jgi:hypothetical protein
VRFDGLVFEKGVGPEGWRAAVLDILGRRP